MIKDLCHNMEFRPAVLEDLPALKSVYTDIVDDLNKKNICIWNEAYPVNFFEEDILKDRLYVLMDGNTLVSAFALCEPAEYEGNVEWYDPEAKALYLFRIAVNLSYNGRGLGAYMLEKSKDEAAARGADYLRLFVVDYNIPAIRLYEKCGFRRVPGMFDNDIGREEILYEYGYEISLF